MQVNLESLSRFTENLNGEDIDELNEAADREAIVGNIPKIASYNLSAVFQTNKESIVCFEIMQILSKY